MKLRDAIFYVIASAYVVACLDLSPVHYVAKDAGGGPDEDAGNADAATSDAGNYAQECGACFTAMCGMALDACNAEPKCGVYIACMTETKCWDERIVDFNNAPMCYSVCAQKADIVSQVDPALGVFVPLLACAQGPTQCAPVCAPSHSQ